MALPAEELPSGTVRTEAPDRDQAAEDEASHDARANGRNGVAHRNGVAGNGVVADGEAAEANGVAGNGVVAHGEAAEANGVAANGVVAHDEAAGANGVSANGVAAHAQTHQLEAALEGVVSPIGLNRRGIRLLHGLDAVTLFAAMSLITTVRYGIDWPAYSHSYYLVGFAVATLIHLVVYDLGGLYEPEQRIEAPRWLPRAAWGTAIAVLLTGAVGLAFSRYLMPRGNLVVMVVVGTAVISANRLASRWLRRRSYREHKPRVLLIGTSEDVDMAAEHIADAARGIEVAGTAQDTTGLLANMTAAAATDVLLLSDDPIESIYPDPFEELEGRHMCVYRRVKPADTLLGLQRSQQIAGMPFVALRMHAMPRHRLRLKRVIDLGLLLAFSPLILTATGLAAAYTRIRAGRGVIYRQTRVGRDGRPFTILKFRTMRHDAEHAGGPQLAVQDDDRVVAGMAWFRATRLDELPQFANVLRGEMSIVGPRPERVEQYVELENQLPGYRRRHDVPPGITGLAQILGHYQTDPAYKLGHDLQYIINWSPVLDFMILVRSVGVIVRRDGL